MRYFLGIDTGATKSHALIADETGQIVGFGEGGTGNPEIIGYDGLARVLNTITDVALDTAKIEKNQIAGMGFGIAGFDWPSDRMPTSQSIEALGIDAPFELVNDAMLGVIAGTSEGWGVGVGAGTSCNCWGRDRHGREGRITGNGAAMGEYAGAHELVRKAFEVISRAWSQRGPQTTLTVKLLTYTGASDEIDLFEGIARKRYKIEAKAAPLIFEAAAEGDSVAQELIEWAARELGGLALGIIRQLHFEALDFEIVLAGSFYKGSPVIQTVMQETIHTIAPGARLVRLTVPPVVGGVLLGMEQAGVNFTAARLKLLESADFMNAISVNEEVYNEEA